jgi:hypothetical protein
LSHSVSIGGAPPTPNDSEPDSSASVLLQQLLVLHHHDRKMRDGKAAGDSHLAHLRRGVARRQQGGDNAECDADSVRALLHGSSRFCSVWNIIYRIAVPSMRRRDTKWKN